MLTMKAITGSRVVGTCVLLVLLVLLVVLRHGDSGAPARSSAAPRRR